MSKKIEFKILGSKVGLRTSETDPDRVDAIVSLVSDKIKEAEKRVPKGSAPHQVTLLALLDLAEDYLDARERTVQFKNTVEARSSELMNLLESELK